MSDFIIKTNEHKQVVDITDWVNELLSEQSKKEGLIFLFVKHTTCSLSTADLDPGTDQDYLNAFEELIPDLDYKHPHDPNHVGDHINSTLIGPSVTVPFNNKKVRLGTWQKVVLIELNGPRDREIIFNIL